MNLGKHAVILAHPNPGSFTATLARTYPAEVEAQGATAILRDLYAIGFDPCLKADEIPQKGQFGPRPDVAAERELLKDVGVFAFFYPLWFNAPPAIAKGYVDRVFSLGFGFEPQGGRQAPLLDGRQLISFTVSGAPEEWVRETGAYEALHALFDKHLAAMCGLSLAGHVHFGGVVPGYPAAAVEKAKEDVRAAVKRSFPPLGR